MATIKYQLRSKNENAPIYIRFSINREKNYRRKTGLYINPKYWSVKKAYPITKNADAKNTNTHLKHLEGFILEQYNTDNAKGIDITSDWLQTNIDLYFNRKKIENLDYLVNYYEYFLQNLPYKVTDKGKKGVSVSTLKKYKTIQNKIIAFEKYRKKRILIKDIDLKFRSELIKYFIEIDKIKDNTTGRYIRFVKTVCLDAKNNGIETHPQLKEFKGYTVKAQKITLSFDELEQIKNTQTQNTMLEITKDWLLIACYTGQRISDFMRMTKDHIQQIQNFDFIVLEQVKTEKLVQIPVHNEVKNILNKRNGNFPPLYTNKTDSNNAMFNKYVKKLCKLAGINEQLTGHKRNTDRTSFEKWELVASHIGRRSFATNFYGNPKYPTPLLMNITAHGTEKQFLEYIGKKPIDYSLQLAEIWAKEALREKKKPNLRVVEKLAVNQ